MPLKISRNIKEHTNHCPVPIAVASALWQWPSHPSPTWPQHGPSMAPAWPAWRPRNAEFDKTAAWTCQICSQSRIPPGTSTCPTCKRPRGTELRRYLDDLDDLDDLDSGMVRGWCCGCTPRYGLTAANISNMGSSWKLHIIWIWKKSMTW